MGDEKPMGQVIQIDEARIRDHLETLQFFRIDKWSVCRG